MSSLVEKMLESVPSWGAKMAYGESTTVGEHVLVPAALVIFGFGAGEGSGEMTEGGAVPAGKGEGSGGGGGGYIVPIGAYIGDSTGLTFRPNLIAMLIVVVPLLSTLGWAVARIGTALNTGRASR